MHRSVAHIKQFLFSREGALFMALVIGAIVIRIPLMLYHGYYGDLSAYIKWGENVTQHFTSIYTTTPGNNGSGLSGRGVFYESINYPPATPYLFGAAVYLYNHLLEPFFHVSLDTLARRNGIGPFLAKIPLLLADIAALVYLYIQARKRQSATFTLLVLASFAFSPALLYNGMIWGQTDGVVSLPLLVALFALISERYILAGVSLALVVLLKPQPVIFVPLILLYLVRWAGWRPFIRFTAAGVLTGTLLLLPILVPHFQLMDMLNNMQTASYNDSSWLTSHAFNFWWLIGYGHQHIGATLLGIKSGTIGILLFGAVSLVSAIQIWRHREPIYLCLGMAVQVFGFFMFMGGQHERYLFLFIPLALASIILAERKNRPHLIALYVLGTLLCFLNMVVGVGGSRFGNDRAIPLSSLQPLNTYLFANFEALARVLAVLHLGAFLYALYVYLAQPFEPAEQARPDISQGGPDVSKHHTAAVTIFAQ